MTTPEQVLNVRMLDNDAVAATVREYLAALLLRVWKEGEGFSGKRPFGNSSWEYELYDALTAANLMGVEDFKEGDQLIEAAIRSLARKNTEM